MIVMAKRGGFLRCQRTDIAHRARIISHKPSGNVERELVLLVEKNKLSMAEERRRIVLRFLMVKMNSSLCSDNRFHI